MKSLIKFCSGMLLAVFAVVLFTAAMSSNVADKFPSKRNFEKHLEIVQSPSYNRARRMIVEDGIDYSEHEVTINYDAIENNGKLTRAQKSYVKVLAELALEEYQNPDYKVHPVLTITQAIVESRWGRSDLARVANNHFGIKGKTKGAFRGCPKGYVLHDDDAPSEKFKCYPSLWYSVRDHSKFLTEGKRYKGMIECYSDYDCNLDELARSGYATSGQYAALNRSVYSQINGGDIYENLN